MRFFSAISDRSDALDGATGLIEAAQSALAGRIDVVFFFASAHHVDELPDVLERLWLRLDPRCLVGCSAEGVIGADREIERGPAMSILAADLPDVRCHPFHVGTADWPDLLADSQTFAEIIGPAEQARLVIAFGDPFTTPAGPLLARFDQARLPLVGGIASAGERPGENLLWRNDGLYEEGMVGLTLSGPIDVHTVVSQGARPVGQPFIITRARENIIEQLGGRPALKAMAEVVAAMSGPDQNLLAGGLLVGRAISEYRDRFGRGDFLVRNVVGIDRSAESITVAEPMRIGQTVQFHVRDAASATDDLEEKLSLHADASAAGGLIISCNGRGSRLFDQPCHDIGLARRRLPQTPLAGFFAAGEFGPVAGRNFIHGHTATIALFRPSAGSAKQA